jgi:single-stranded DNA-binding protein
VYVEGRLRTRKRQDSGGAERFSTEVIVDNFIFLGTKGEGEVEGEESPLGISEELFDEEIPF